jgi:hypothetical protein
VRPASSATSGDSILEDARRAEVVGGRLEDFSHCIKTLETKKPPMLLLSLRSGQGREGAPRRAADFSEGRSVTGALGKSTPARHEDGGQPRQRMGRESLAEGRTKKCIISAVVRSYEGKRRETDGARGRQVGDGL